jgi:glucosamine-6-phosphate deaminase
MNKHLFSNATEASKHLAKILATQIQEKPDSVIGFATGRTMNAVYYHLVADHGDNLDCSQVKAFVIDEYIGLKVDSKNSYRYYMHHHLYDHLNFTKENLYFPDVHSQDLDMACSQYEAALEKMGNLDILLLGIGVNGHIALNEPGSAYDSKTRVVALSQATMNSNSAVLKNESPNTAVTMGIGTLLKAKKIFLIATGVTKSTIIKKLMSGNETSDVPASFLRGHENVELLLDKDSSKLLD